VRSEVDAVDRVVRRKLPLLIKKMGFAPYLWMNTRLEVLHADHHARLPAQGYNRPDLLD
jgi:hypothetical protein